MAIKQLITAKNKNVGFYLLPVPRIEAFALPSVVERATSKPTPICVHYPLYGYRTHYNYTMRHTSKGMWLIHIPRASTVAMLKTTPESCEVSIRQEQSVK